MTDAAVLPEAAAPGRKAMEAGRLLFAASSRFIAAADVPAALPPETLPEMALVGRSNVGKSSLLNALASRKNLARVAHRPGRTRTLNFYDIGGRLMLVDLPGYGYAAVGRAEARGWAETINFYLGRRAVLAGAVLMIDARHGMKDGDRAALELLAANGVSCIAVLTKIDKVKTAARPAMMAEVAAELARYPAAFPALHAVSAHDGFAGRPLKSRAMTEKTAPAPADAVAKAATLSAALPYMRRYAGKSIVVKYGGHAMGDIAVAEKFAHDIVLLKQVGINPIVVHGGGPQIGQMLERLKIKSSFIDGLRVTDQATVEIVEMVLSGSINKELVAYVNKAGGRAIGLSGKDADLIRARKLSRKRADPGSNIEKVLDLGFVGEPYAVDASVLEDLARSDIIPA